MTNPLDYMFPDTWEYDFSPLPTEGIMADEEVKRVNCSECHKTLPEWDTVTVKKHTDGEDVEMHFCGEPCANSYYLRRLRESGI